MPPDRRRFGRAPRRDLAADVGDRSFTPLPPKASPPSRSSTASRLPVEAPEDRCHPGRRCRGAPRPRSSGCRGCRRSGAAGPCGWCCCRRSSTSHSESRKSKPSAAAPRCQRASSLGGRGRYSRHERAGRDERRARVCVCGEAVESRRFGRRRGRGGGEPESAASTRGGDGQGVGFRRRHRPRSSRARREAAPGSSSAASPAAEAPGLAAAIANHLAALDRPASTRPLSSSRRRRRRPPHGGPDRRPNSSPVIARNARNWVTVSCLLRGEQALDPPGGEQRDGDEVRRLPRVVAVTGWLYRVLD